MIRISRTVKHISSTQRKFVPTERVRTIELGEEWYDSNIANIRRGDKWSLMSNLASLSPCHSVVDWNHQTIYLMLKKHSEKVSLEILRTGNNSMLRVHFGLSSNETERMMIKHYDLFYRVLLSTAIAVCIYIYTKTAVGISLKWIYEKFTVVNIVGNINKFHFFPLSTNNIEKHYDTYIHTWIHLHAL